MQLENKVGIIVICYNQANLLRLQVECIRKFCKDDFDIIVVDNSTDQAAIDSIRHHTIDLGCQYLKTNASSQNGSSSHAFASNFAYNHYSEHYKFIMFLDHDCFCVKSFSVVNILGEQGVMAGIGQQKKNKVYFWPGCLMMNNSFCKPVGVDFSPNHDLGLDTGGNLYKIVEAFVDWRFIHFNEAHCENPSFTKTLNNFYSMIYDETFLHMVAGSNWKKEGHHEERINSLINIVIEKTNITP